MKIHEAAKLRKMGADMILVAVRDLKRPGTCLECAVWFLGDGFALWAEVANIPFADPLMAFEQLNKTQAMQLYIQIQALIFTGISPDAEGMPGEHGAEYGRWQVRALEEKVVPVLLKKLQGRVKGINLNAILHPSNNRARAETTQNETSARGEKAN